MKNSSKFSIFFHKNVVPRSISKCTGKKKYFSLMRWSNNTE